MLKLQGPTRHPMDWLRRRFRTRRAYRRFLMCAQHVGWGLNVVLLLLALVAAFRTTIGLPDNARDVIWWIPVIGFALRALDNAYWRTLDER